MTKYLTEQHEEKCFFWLPAGKVWLEEHEPLVVLHGSQEAEKGQSWPLASFLISIQVPKP